MAPARKALHYRSALAAALVAAAAVGFAGPASSAPAILRNALGLDRLDEGRQSTTPIVARYLIDEGGNFTLDRSQPRPLMKFDDSPEVWVLAPSRGPRGDIIYKNDVGEPMLRATRLGGMTVFTPRRPAGSAAAMAGPTSALHMPSIGPGGLFRRVFEASLRTSRAAQHLVEFDAPDADAGSDALIADAAGVTMEAFITLSSAAEGKALMSRVSKIVFNEGAKPAAVLQGATLLVTITPAQGMAGRPSSRRIMRALGLR